MALLEVRNLRKTFPGTAESRRPVISIPSFALDEKKQVALRGPSGSGKTTFLHLVSGILVPDEGAIFLRGLEISSLPESQRDKIRATNFGYVFQTFNLLQGFTVFENLKLAMAFGASPSDPDRPARLLERVGLGNRHQDYPRQLSAGQQQRVALARALVNRPIVILADEPTGNLDEENRDNVIALLQEVCAEESSALLLASHDPAVLRVFSEVHDFLKLNQVGAS